MEFLAALGHVHQQGRRSELRTMLVGIAAHAVAQGLRTRKFGNCRSTETRSEAKECYLNALLVSIAERTATEWWETNAKDSADVAINRVADDFVLQLQRCVGEDQQAGRLPQFIVPSPANKGWLPSQSERTCGSEWFPCCTPFPYRSS